MNTEIDSSFREINAVAANDTDYASSGKIGTIECVCRFVVGMSILMAVTYGLIAAPVMIFVVAVAGFYLIMTTIVNWDPFYAVVGHHPLRRLASVSALTSTLTLSTVLSGQLFVPEVISLLTFIGAITGLTAVHHSGTFAMSRDSDPVQPPNSETDSQGIVPIDIASIDWGHEEPASRDAA